MQGMAGSDSILPDPPGLRIVRQEMNFGAHVPVLSVLPFTLLPGLLWRGGPPILYTHEAASSYMYVC